MDKPQLRLIEKKQEILSIIEASPKMEIGDVWQTHISHSEGRVIHPIQKIQIDHINESLIFNTDAEFLVNKEHPVFIRFNYRNLIFKLEPKEYKITKGTLTCKFPKTAKALEMREKERLSISDKIHFFLTLKPFHKGSTIQNRFKVLDISQHGFGIVTVEMGKEFFIVNKNFWIEAFNDKDLEVHILADVSDINNKAPGIKKGEVRIGLKLNEPMSDELYSSLKEELGSALG